MKTIIMENRCGVDKMSMLQDSRLHGLYLKLFILSINFVTGIHCKINDKGHHNRMLKEI
jgi:hypothetical protein